VTWQLLSVSLLGILSIGIINLLVSFSLALMVALRSRQVHFNQGSRLLKTLALKFWNQPRDFFIPPLENLNADIVAADQK